MRAADHVHVWADTAQETSLNGGPSSSPWLSTLVDVVSQWGWLLAIVVATVLVSAALGDHRTKKDG